MKKRNSNEKLLFFDMDGTLYDLQDVVGMNYQMQVDFYAECCDFSKLETERFFRKNNILPYVSEKANSATELFSRSGLDMFKWQEYRNKNFDVMKIDVKKAAEAHIVREFRQLGSTVLLTSNSIQNVKKILERLELLLEDFDKIVCSDYSYPFPVFSKLKAMKYIMETFDVKPERCLSLGDRYQTDIAPMLELGGSGILVKKPGALGEIFHFLSEEISDTVDMEHFVFYAHAEAK